MKAHVVKIVNIFEAKTQLSRYLQEVEDGNEIIIGRYGRPVAKLVPYRPERPTYRFGLLKGQITIADDFDMPDSQLVAAFEGEGEA